MAYSLVRRFRATSEGVSGLHTFGVRGHIWEAMILSNRSVEGTDEPIQAIWYPEGFCLERYFVRQGRQAFGFGQLFPRCGAQGLDLLAVGGEDVG